MSREVSNLSVTERSFIILRYVGKTPSMAMCEGCGLKFFVPMPFHDDPTAAEEQLRDKYANHECKPEPLAYEGRGAA
jgi:hypothetical protein